MNRVITFQKLGTSLKSITNIIVYEAKILIYSKIEDIVSFEQQNHVTTQCVIPPMLCATQTTGLSPTPADLSFLSSSLLL